MRKIFPDFFKYVSTNVLGMIGLSCYILADTFFVSNALGNVGLTALNLSIPVYGFINGVGLMIGIGGATRYAINKSRNNMGNEVFSHSIALGAIVSVIYVLIGLVFAGKLAILLGADGATYDMTKIYIETTLCFTPVYFLNNTVLAFTRNDNDPRLAMLGMLIASFGNIILDYVFMYPLGMGIFGAAFATGLAPIMSLCVLSVHFIKGKNNFRLEKFKFELRRAIDIVQLGLYSFINEISSSAVLITYNLIILGIAGNIGVAAYGIVANFALVGIAVSNGVAQGIQPIVSRHYGLGNRKELQAIVKLYLMLSVCIAIVIYALVFFNTEGIIKLFNSENIKELNDMAFVGFRIYFIGFFFVGINIVTAAYMSAIEKTKVSFVISMARGLIIIIPVAIVLGLMFGMIGVWLSFVVTEVLVIVYSLINLRRVTI